MTQKNHRSERQLGRQTRKEIKKAVQLTTLIMAHDLAGVAQAQSTNAVPATPPTTNAGTNAPAQQLPDVVVKGAQESYKTDAVALPKLTEPLRDTPESITVVPREVMDDQNATTLRDVLRNVAGISIAAGEGGSQGDNLTLRGFTARNDIFLDGMRDYGSYYRDPFNYEEVEVLDGPQSVMFGRGSTGGVINQVSKTPTLNPFVAGSLTLGTDETRRGTVDINEPVPEFGKHTALRLNLMGNDSGVAGRDVTENKRYGIAPSLEFGINTSTRLTISYLHQAENDIPDYGVPWIATSPAPVARNNYYGFQDDYLNTRVDMATVKLEQDVNEAVTLRDQARYANYSRVFRITEPMKSTVPVALTPTTIDPRNELGGFSTETYLWDQFDVTAKFNTSSFIEHTLVAGVEGGQETSDPSRFVYAGVPGTSYLTPNENQSFSETSIGYRSVIRSTADSFGAYALDTIKFGEHWELSGGVRWDYFGADYVQYIAPAVTANQDVSKPTWRGALIYKPIDIGSIYFDYGTSFNPSAETFSLTSSTANDAPEENESFELGSKWDLLDERLSVRGSIFRTEKSNAREPDPNNTLFTVNAGKQRVDGVELAATGNLTQKWQVIASYDYLASETVSSAGYPSSVGHVLSNVPKNTFSLWTTYELPWNFEIGGGFNYVGPRSANGSTLTTATPDETVGGYWTLNAMAKYTLNKHVTLQANIYNLTDNFYYDQLHPSHVIPGPAISALFSTSFKF
jgi:catecholate siderophore receptor